MNVLYDPSSKLAVRSALNGKASRLSPIKEMIFIVLFVSGGGMLGWLEKLQVFISGKIVEYEV